MSTLAGGARLLAEGSWTADAITSHPVPSTFAPDAATTAAIAAIWATRSRAEPQLFDGPLARLESLHVAPERFTLGWSTTSYRSFLGTNARAVHAQDGSAQLPTTQRANPLGTSAILRCRDGVLVFGRRSLHSALYPGGIHPLGGCLEPAQAHDPCAEMARELAEEVGLRREAITDLRLIALIEDAALAQPELIFAVQGDCSAATLTMSMNEEEHSALFLVRDDPAQVRQAIASAPQVMTPLCRSVIDYWHRMRSSGAWA